MKIVHALDYFQPQIGYQHYFLCKYELAMGHDVSVVTCDRYFPFPSYSSAVQPVLGPRRVACGWRSERGIRTLRLPVWLEYPRSAQLLIKGLVAALCELAPDVVVSGTAFSWSDYRIARAKDRIGARLVFNSDASYFNTDLRSSVARRLYRSMVLERIIAPQVRASADVLVANGEGHRHLLSTVLGVPAERIYSLHLGADTELFRFDAEARGRLRQELGVTPESLLILHAGKLTPNKDVHVLLEAAASLLAHQPEARLLIVGGGDPGYMRLLKSLAASLGIASQVIWKDLVPNDQLPGLLSASDLGVWPGDHSNIIEEAIATGLPVILPDSFAPMSSSAHLLSAGNGVSFRRGDVGELRAHLEGLVGDADARHRMRVAAAELAESELSWQQVTSRFVDLYERAVN